MKKRIIALSVAAAMGSFSGSALAQATQLVFNPAGVGHIAIVPYFSTQNSNVTLLNITNTDRTNGKAVKIRFRGASNSDDIFDFQLFLSPADMWTAEIRRGADGRSELVTTDKSCTLPSSVNQSFIIDRTAPQATDRPAETREGYIEIFNMGDIVLGAAASTRRALYTATKHVANVAPCTSATLTALTNENAATDYLDPPTTGLMANWTIINVSKISSYSGEAAAIEGRTAANVASTGSVVFWDQRSTALTQVQADANTADPLLRGAAPIVAGARYDLPDLSTPYYPTSASPQAQARALSDAITTRTAAAEFFNLASVGAATDWVVSFPTRRYFAAVRYTGGVSPPSAVYDAAATNIYFNAGNTVMGNTSNGGKNYQLCSVLGTSAVGFFNREETATVTSDIVISPGTPVSLSLCGEVSVVGVNAGSVENTATFASVARANIDNGFTEGWGFITTPATAGLPFLAQQFTRVANTTTNVFYALSYPARIVTRGAP